MGKPRRLLAGIAALALGILVPAGVSATPAHPVFTVGGDHAFLAEANDLWFSFSGLPSASSAAQLEIDLPRAFRVSPRHPVGFALGGASIVASAARAKPVTYTGRLAVTTQRVFAAESAKGGCPSGHHTAYWQMLVASGGTTLQVPVGLELGSTETTLTVCLGSLAASGITPTQVYFQTSRTFRNPADTAAYAIPALVSPAGADGSPDPAKAFGLVAIDALPQQLYVEVTRTTGGQLVVTGALRAGGYARSGVVVNVAGGPTVDSSHWKRIGSATTRSDGSYRLERSAAGVKYLYAWVEARPQRRCSKQDPPAAAPCRSETTAGIASPEIEVQPGG